MMKKKLIDCMIMLAVSNMLLFPMVAQTKERTLNVPHHSQETLYWCGATVVQMWTNYLTGKIYPQKQIAGWDILFRGFSSYEVENRIEKYTGKSFDVNGLIGEKAARKKIYTELIEQARPLAINGTTVRADGTERAGGHWLLIHGADISGEDNGYKVKWVKIRDPLLNSKWAANYNVLGDQEKVSGDRLFNHHWKVYSGTNERQAVDD